MSAQRGSGEFERISWEEALRRGRGAIAARARDLRQCSDPRRVAVGQYGDVAQPVSGLARFLNMFGGSSGLWSSMSCEAEIFSVKQTFGPDVGYKSAGREPTDYVNSKLILMWGWAPADGTFGTGTPQYLKQAKEQGVRIVCIDPRRHRSSKMLAEEHIFIRPSTDAAALIAMAYVIVSEGLHDQDYLDTYVQGFDEHSLPEGAPKGGSYRAYLMGEDDGIVKTPEWASDICGIRAETIRRLAIEFGSTKPAAIQCGYAPGSHPARGTVPSRGLCLGGDDRQYRDRRREFGREQRRRPAGPGIKALPEGKNPIDAGISTPLLADCLEKGTAGGYPADIKFIYSMGGDIFNQAPNAPKIAKALDNVEFIVGQDHFLTPTTRHADIVLPATTVLGAQRRSHALGGRRALRDLHEAGDPADV